MLKKYQKALVSSLAKELLKTGMVWGDELEEYIKINLKGNMKIQNDTHYLKIENYFLDVVEKERTECIEIRTGNTIERVKTMKEAAVISGISYPAISSKLKIKKKVKIRSKKNTGKVVEFEILKLKMSEI